MSKRLNLIGKRFGNLTVIADGGTIEKWHHKYKESIQNISWNASKM